MPKSRAEDEFGQLKTAVPRGKLAGRFFLFSRIFSFFALDEFEKSKQTELSVPKVAGPPVREKCCQI